MKSFIRHHLYFETIRVLRIHVIVKFEYSISNFKRFSEKYRKGKSRKKLQLLVVQVCEMIVLLDVFLKTIKILVKDVKSMYLICTYYLILYSKLQKMNDNSKTPFILMVFDFVKIKYLFYDIWKRWCLMSHKCIK